MRGDRRPVDVTSKLRASGMLRYLVVTPINATECRTNERIQRR